jgi:hypothetical protein
MPRELIVHLIKKGLFANDDEFQFLKKDLDEFQFLKKDLTEALDSANSDKQYEVCVTIEEDYTQVPQKNGVVMDVVILPFMDESCTRFSGLEEIRKIRLELNDFKAIPFFVCWTNCLLPDFLHPERIEVGPLKLLLGTPHFGEVKKAILYAEAIYTGENSEGQSDLLNFIVLSSQKTFFDDLADRIFKVIDLYPPEKFEIFRREYYRTFVDFYSFSKNIDGDKLEKTTIADLQNICQAESEKANKKKAKAEKEGAECKRPDSEQRSTQAGQEEVDVVGRNPYPFSESLKERIGLNDLAKKDRSQSLYPVLELADFVHCFLHGRKPPEKSGTHNIPLEIFSSPVPFHLQELLDARAKIESLVGDRKLKLLLIDNKDDKLEEKPDKPETGALRQLLHDFGLKNIIKIVFPETTDRTFQLDRFKKYSSEYAQKLSREIEKSDFILLDFFLNEDKTYLAFDFINDIEKRFSGARSPIWYFITSAFYDAVSRYSQSGLLAEHYESAVVSSGDDPMNSMRRIIFVYKLITFIHARWKSFDGSEKDVFQAELLICEDWGCPADSSKSWEECLRGAQAVFKRYLVEYDQIAKIFPNAKEEGKEFRRTVELLDKTLNDFLWLPEADWPIINKEIESIDLRLQEDFVKNKISGLKRPSSQIRFACPRIRKEIERRMEIY